MRYDLSAIQNLMDQTIYLKEISKAKPIKENIFYCRVRSHQKDDLKRQRRSLESWYPTFRVVEDICSGLNSKRKVLLSILELHLQGNIKFAFDRFKKTKLPLIQGWYVFQTCDHDLSDSEVA